MEHKEDKMYYVWGDSRRFNSYAGYFRRLFGERVQKVTIDAGFTCPNRDGTVSRGGYTYCNNDAFNPSYCTSLKSVRTQIEEGIEFHAARYRRADNFLAYFQAYSNTYKPLDELKALYEEALVCSRGGGYSDRYPSRLWWTRPSSTILPGCRSVVMWWWSMA